MTPREMEAQALLHLRRSIGTSAGMHSRNFARLADKLRAENALRELGRLSERMGQEL
jgi:hypothetical protein